MPQNADTGRQGLWNGYSNADQIGDLLGAVRVASNSNKFRWNDRIVVIKTGSSAVVTHATLAKVAAVVYGDETNTGWVLYEIDPETFEQLSVRSQSNNHNEDYRLVRRSQIREHGQQIIV
jgi:hypothetical protein